MTRFPQFELSYETISYKKVDPQYNIVLAIPTGKKVIVWYTFYLNEDVIYVFDLNREKKIIRGYQHEEKVNVSNNVNDNTTINPLYKGTVVYGTCLPNSDTIIIEDIFFYMGIPTMKSPWYQKFDFLGQMMKQDIGINAYLPVIWKNDLSGSDRYSTKMPPNIGYTVHHIQYRTFTEIKPYINVNINHKFETPIESKQKPINNVIGIGNDLIMERKPYPATLNKPQYRCSAVFRVVADIQYDIYHLYAYGKTGQPVYYNIAYIPNYKTSIFMNNLFRHIRENQNLDYIEESDDEADFQNTDITKYVDLVKVVNMECVFNTKFKRWTPVKVVQPNKKIVHIGQL